MKMCIQNKRIGLMGMMWISILMGEEVTELAPLVVEGRHFAELEMSVPQSVLRIGRDELDRSGSRTVPEALERLGGIRLIDTTGNGVASQVSLRGFGDNSGLRALVIVDGQVYNPPDMGGINWTGIDLSNVETMEILRGGQTVLYGNHAVSGVIKLTTRPVGESPEGEVSAMAGSYGDYRVKAGAGVRAGDIGIRAGASWHQSDGYRENAFLRNRSGYLTWDTLGEGPLSLGGRINYSRSRMQLPWPVSYDQMLADPRSSSGGLIVSSEALQWTQSAEGSPEWGDWELLAGYLNRKQDWAFFGTGAENILDRLTVNPRARKTFASGYLVGGIDVSRDRLKHSGYLDEERLHRQFDAEIERTSIGGYVFGSIDIVEGVALSGGLRLESADTDNRYDQYVANQILPSLATGSGDVPNPDYKNPPDIDPDLSFEGPSNKSGWAGEVSLSWSLSSSLSLWGGWDRVYRYPSMDETTSYQGYFLSDPLNKNLDPETGDNFELGLKKSGRNWYTSITAFHLELDGEISYIEYVDEISGEYVRLNENVGNSTRQGLEADFSYQNEDYGWKFAMTLVDVDLSRDDNPAVMPLVPDLQVSASLWYKPLDSLTLQLHGRYLDDQVQGNDYQRDLRAIPSYYLVHVSTNWEVTDDLVFVAGVNNVLDKVHAVSAYSGGFYAGVGRQAFLSMRYQY